MTPNQQSALVGYIDRLRLALKLHNWNIEVSEKGPDSETVDAATFVRYEAHFAEMQYRRDLPDKTAEYVRQTVVHELLHLYLEHFAVDCKAAMEEGLSTSAAEIVNTLLSREYERMTEDLAVAIADHYPLIEWPQEVEVAA